MCEDIVSVTGNTINVHEPKIKVDLQKFTEVHQFRFDVAFGENCSCVSRAGGARVCTKPAKGEGPGIWGI